MNRKRTMIQMSSGSFSLNSYQLPLSRTSCWIKAKKAFSLQDVALSVTGLHQKITTTNKKWLIKQSWPQAALILPAVFSKRAIVQQYTSTILIKKKILALRNIIFDSYMFLSMRSDISSSVVRIPNTEYGKWNYIFRWEFMLILICDCLFVYVFVSF